KGMENGSFIGRLKSGVVRQDSGRHICSSRCSASAAPSADGGKPAVGRDAASREITGFVANQIGDGGCAFGSAANAAYRHGLVDEIVDEAAISLIFRGYHRRVDVTWADADDADILIRQFDGKRP